MNRSLISRAFSGYTFYEIALVGREGKGIIFWAKVEVQGFS
jgi:hypothetical protein